MKLCSHFYNLSRAHSWLMVVQMPSQDDRLQSLGFKPFCYLTSKSSFLRELLKIFPLMNHKDGSHGQFGFAPTYYEDFFPGTLTALLGITLLFCPSGLSDLRIYIEVTVANFEILNVFYFLLKRVYVSPVTRSNFYLNFLLP